MPVKKTSAAKKKTAAKKTTSAKRGPGRPKGSKNKPKETTAKRGPGRPKGSKNSTTKKTASKSNVKNVKKPSSNRGGFHREINEETGFVVGTDQDLIAQELLAGGDSRAEIVERLEGILDPETRNGTPKMITNMVGGVLNKMLAAGYTVESSFLVVPPTPASKRAAARKKK